MHNNFLAPSHKFLLKLLEYSADSFFMIYCEVWLVHKVTNFFGDSYLVVSRQPFFIGYQHMKYFV